MLPPRLPFLLWFMPLLVAVVGPPRVGWAQPPDLCFDSYEQAQRLRKSQQLQAATAQLKQCLQPSCPEMIRNDCTIWLGEIATEQPSFIPVAQHEGEDLVDVRVLVDGRLVVEHLAGLAIELDPGAYELRFEAQGYNPVIKQLVLRMGEKRRRVVAELSPLKKERVARPPAAAIALGGVGLAGLGVFGYFAVKSHGEREDLDWCKGTCEEDEVDEVRRHQIAADVSLLVGVVASGAATFILLRPRIADAGAGSTRSRLQVGVSGSASGVGVGLEGSF